jgi:hypothetical protein
MVRAPAAAPGRAAAATRACLMATALGSIIFPAGEGGFPASEGGLAAAFGGACGLTAARLAGAAVFLSTLGEGLAGRLD